MDPTTFSTAPGDTLVFENDRVRVWSMTLTEHPSAPRCDERPRAPPPRRAAAVKVRSGDVEIACSDSGSGEPVVLLHGGEVVRTLTVAATVAHVRFDRKSIATDIVDLPPDRRTRKMLEFVLSPEGQASERLVAETLAVLVHREPDADAQRLDAVRTVDLTSRLPEITAPTLLVYGGDDPAASPEIGRQIADAIPGARLEVLPGVRHGITLEGKEATARLLRDFVLAHPSTDRNQER